jgi:uncharacterized protein (DUF433 family)
MVTHRRTFTHIVWNSGILGGEPIVAGTRIPVRAIVLTNRYAPNAEYMYRAYPFVSRADTDEALAYYHDHQAEIDTYIAENEDDDSATEGGA